MLQPLVASVPLALATLQDLRYKAVSDSINYFMVIFSWLYFVFLVSIKKVFVLSVISAIFLILLFYFLYLTKAMAIGDVFAFLWLSPLIVTIFSFKKVLLFLTLSFLYGIFISSIYSTYLLYKNKNNLYLINAFSIISSGLAIYFFAEGIININLQYFLYSSILLCITYFFVLLVGKRAEQYLVFERKASELVEGDWVLGFEVRVKKDNFEKAIKNVSDNEKISEDKLKNEFKVVTEKENVVLKLRKNQPALTKNQILILRELEESGEKMKFRVKEGYPFIPAIFLAFLTTLLI